MKKKWKLKEESDAKDFKGRTTVGSGNKWYDPGDSTNEVWLVENKQTDYKSFSVSKKLWEVVAHKALFRFRYPMLSLQIQDLHLVIIDKKDFLKLIKNADPGKPLEANPVEVVELGGTHKNRGQRK